MRIAFSLLAGILVTALLVYAAYLLRPTGATEIEFTVEKPAFETKTFEVRTPVVSPQGAVEQQSRTFNYAVSHSVPEQRVEVVESAPAEKLRFWVIIACAVLCGVYSTFVLAIWIKLTLANNKNDPRLAKIEKRLNSIVTFGFGAVAGILAVGTPSTDLEKQQALADLQGSKTAAAAYRTQLESLTHDRSQLVSDIQNAFANPTANEPANSQESGDTAPMPPVPEANPS